MSCVPTIELAMPNSDSHPQWVGPLSCLGARSDGRAVIDADGYLALPERSSHGAVTYSALGQCIPPGLGAAPQSGPTDLGNPSIFRESTVKGSSSKRGGACALDT